VMRKLSIIDGKRKCSHCEEMLELTAFHERGGKKKGQYHTVCKECDAKRQKQWYTDHREEHKAHVKTYKLTIGYYEVRLREKYKLTGEEVMSRIIAQEGLCALCFESLEGRRACIDHDHKTGKVREILCSGCNTMLGFARDDPEILQKAIDYLERHTLQNTT